MRFTHTDERQMLSDTLDKFIKAETKIGTLTPEMQARGYDADLWAKMAELGVLGALFTEQQGGFGGHGFDAMVVCQALGQGCVRTPIIESTVMGGTIAAATTSPDQLETVMSAAALPILAHLEPEGGMDVVDVQCQATEVGGQWRLNGTKSVVAFAGSATSLYVTAKLPRDGIGLFTVDPTSTSLDQHSYATVDGAQAADLTFNETSGTLISVDAETLVRRALYAGMAAQCAEAVGLMTQTVKLTGDYLKTRKQFGVELAKFQALQHRFTDMMISLESAMSAAIIAADALAAAQQGNVEAMRRLHGAKYSICQCSMHIGEEAVQMHGGIGVTWEYDLSHYHKRLVGLESELGDEDFHLSQFIALTAA